MRRQYGAGGTPAGSSCRLQLDPLSLPLQFDTRDARADGGVRRVEINRERVVLRRAVRGMRMAIRVRVNEFLGIAVRGADEGQMLTLVHRDPSLSIPLLITKDDDEIKQALRVWGQIFSLPHIDEDEDHASTPAQRRRRRNVISTRRPKILMRRHNNSLLSEAEIHRGEYEIIARN